MPTTKRVPKLINKCNGSCRGITTSAIACSLASLRAFCLVAGSLPSRALVQMSLRGNTSPPRMKQVAVCNQLAYFTCTNFGGRKSMSYRLSRLFLTAHVSEIPPTERGGGSVAVFQATKGVRCACEQSRGSALVKPLSNFVILSEVEGSPGRVPYKRLSCKQRYSRQSLRHWREGFT